MAPIIRCDESHVGPLAKLLARAFLHDPLYKYIFPNPATRESLTAWEMGSTALYGIRFGEVYATSDLSGCAAWLPPGETDFTEERMAEIGMLDSGAHLGAESAERLMRFVAESEAFHRRVVADLHWYLVLLAVDPPRQREGIGSALLADVLARADKDKVPVYLEATNPINIPFYEKFGFKVRSEASLSDGGSHLWYMVRQPAVGPLR